MTIAPAKPGQLPALAALMAGSALLRRYGVTERSARRTLAEARRRSKDMLLVAADAGRPVGLSWLIVTAALDRSGYLRLLLVAPGSRSRGVGAALLDRTERAARARRCRHLVLLVTRTNRRARTFYERQGYRHVGDLPGFVRAGIDEALYMKSL